MRRILIFLLILFVGMWSAIAQESDCTTLVQNAITTTIEQCDNLSSGEVCFGHGAIDAVVNCEDAPDFDSPGDTLPLDVVCSLRSSALELPDQWGLAPMRVSVTDSESDVAYVLLGDVAIYNAGSSVSEIEAQAKNAVEVHIGPASNYATIGSLVADQIVRANACNCTGNWLRVRLESGEIGWVAARNMTVLGDVDSLPSVGVNTPVYKPMQAFTFMNSSSNPSCEDAPENGVLIQTPATMTETQLEINGVGVSLSSTVFAQNEVGGVMTLEVLAGDASVTVNNFTANISAGARVTISMTDDDEPGKISAITPYTIDDVLNLPLNLLPQAIDPTEPLNADIPKIVGAQPCAVIADRGPTICPVYFLNPDGDPITQMTVEFVSAPQGEWVGSVRQPPEYIEGDSISGVLAWESTCSLASGVNFIGPVVWSITVTDEEGHISEPFQAQFNCVEG